MEIHIEAVCIRILNNDFVCFVLSPYFTSNFYLAILYIYIYIYTNIYIWLSGIIGESVDTKVTGSIPGRKIFLILRLW